PAAAAPLRRPRGRGAPRARRGGPRTGTSTAFSFQDDFELAEIGSTRPPCGREALLAGMSARLDEHRAAAERDLHTARQLRSEAASFALCVERLRERLRSARASLGQPAQA
ncbi:unnamed protein product, partial [Prorocentrum cordatum]